MSNLIITSAPEASESALWEVRRAAGSPVAETALDDGVLLVDVDDATAIADALAARRPVFLRHLAPADVAVPLRSVPEDLAVIAAAVDELLAALPARFLARPHAVQARLTHQVKHPYSRYAIAEPLRAIFNRYGPEDVRCPEVALSVYCAAEMAYMGVWPVSYSLSDWPGGERRFAVTPEQVSRAEFKLLEAIEVFSLSVPAEGCALDLGAAPGGWTRILAERGLWVLAVDPARLDRRVLDLPEVRHLRSHAEEYLFTQLRGKDADHPDRFEIILNDMRLDARDSARLMVEAAPLLLPDGWGLITLKLPHEGAEEVYHAARGILGQGYSVIGSRQLFHNRSEVTVALRGRSSEE